MKEGKKTQEQDKERRDHIGFQLRLIHNMIDAHMKESNEGNECAVTQIQHWIIRYMEHSRDRDVFQRDLEEAMHVSRATISATLQVMEKNGLIQRTSVKQDARLKKITLTQKSLDYSIKTKERVKEMEERLTLGMTENETELLRDLLLRVRKNLEEWK